MRGLNAKHAHIRPAPEAVRVQGVPCSGQEGGGVTCTCPTWMVNTMPTKPAVSSATPMDLGPTSFSCSRCCANGSSLQHRPAPLRAWCCMAITAFASDPARLPADMWAHVPGRDANTGCARRRRSSDTLTLQDPRGDLPTQDNGSNAFPEPFWRLGGLKPLLQHCRQADVSTTHGAHNPCHCLI